MALIYTQTRRHNYDKKDFGCRLLKQTVVVDVLSSVVVYSLFIVAVIVHTFIFVYVCLIIVL